MSSGSTSGCRLGHLHQIALREDLGARVDARERDPLVALDERRHVRVPLGAHRDELPFARLHLLHVRDRLLVVHVLRANHDDGHLLVDERDRPVLHLAGRVPLGVDVRDLLQLERPLERDRDTPCRDRGRACRARCTCFFAMRLMSSAFARTSRICCGRLDERVEDPARALLRERVAAAPEVDGEEEHRRELRR